MLFAFGVRGVRTRAADDTFFDNSDVGHQCEADCFYLCIYTDSGCGDFEDREIAEKELDSCSARAGAFPFAYRGDDRRLARDKGFYGRAYFFRENDHIDVMMLLTPDEGKEPLVYAIDDLAKAAAKETDMQEEKEDLSVMLAKGAAGN